MSDTPRMKAAQMTAIEHMTGDVYRVGCDIEHELNAANAEIEEKRKDVVWLATEKAKLEEQLMDAKNKHAVLIADVVLNEDRAEQIKRLRKANFQLREGAEEQKQRIQRLEDRIHRASMAFFRDGSDGQVASGMLSILEEERGKK